MRKQAIIIAAAAALGLSGAAWAGSSHGDNGGCQGNCAGSGGAPVTNQGGSGGAGGNAAGGVGVGVGIGVGLGIGQGGSATATGGQGGQGGQGGMGGVGIGGSVAGSGNSNVRNTNANSNRNYNTAQQGQQQGQLQGQQQHATATGGSASNGGNTVSGSQANGQSVTVEGDNVQYRVPASTAYAPTLTSGANTCMGSTSAGGQGVTFGVSFGTTWTDGGCEARYDAQALNALGLRDAAIARLCQRGDVAKAIGAAGGKCPDAGAKPAKAALADRQPSVYIN